THQEPNQPKRFQPDDGISPRLEERDSIFSVLHHGIGTSRNSNSTSYCFVSQWMNANFAGSPGLAALPLLIVSVICTWLGPEPPHDDPQCWYLLPLSSNSSSRLYRLFCQL